MKKILTYVFLAIVLGICFYILSNPYSIGVFLSKTRLEAQEEGVPILPHRVEENKPKSKEKALKPWEEDFFSYAPKDSDLDIQVWCIAKAVFFESRGEPERGMILTAQVIINRTKSKQWPDTPCEVVYQPSNNPNKPKLCQFTFTCVSQGVKLEDDVDSWNKALDIAYKIRYNLYKGYWSKADHYHADYVSPSWRSKLRYTGRVGKHLYYASN